MLLQALHVEIETKNLNLQVTLLVQKGVGTTVVLTVLRVSLIKVVSMTVWEKELAVAYT